MQSILINIRYLSYHLFCLLFSEFEPENGIYDRRQPSQTGENLRHHDLLGHALYYSSK